MCLSREVKGNKVDRQAYFITIAHTDETVEPIETLFEGKPHLQTVLRNIRYNQNRRKEIARDRANKMWADRKRTIKKNEHA